LMPKRCPVWQTLQSPNSSSLPRVGVAGVRTTTRPLFSSRVVVHSIKLEKERLTNLLLEWKPSPKRGQLFRTKQERKQVKTPKNTKPQLSLSEKTLVLRPITLSHLRACVVRGPADGRCLVWWVIDNVVWTNSWPSITGAGCGLIDDGAGCRWRTSAKGRCRWGLQVCSRQVGLVWGTWWPTGSSASHMVARTTRQSRGRFLGWSSKPRSSRDYVGAKTWVEIGGRLHQVCGGF
jgi:hypothetical protein